MERAPLGDTRQVQGRVEFELARERLEDVQLRRVRAAHPEVEHPVEPPGAQERGVEQVGTVRRPDDEDVCTPRPGLAPRAGPGEPVELGEELADDAVHDAPRVSVVAALGRDGVELVKEDDAGACIARALEHAPDVGLRFADIHVEQLGPFDREEVECARCRDGFGDKRLARTGRTVEQDTWGEQVRR